MLDLATWLLISLAGGWGLVSGARIWADRRVDTATAARLRRDEKYVRKGRG